MQNNDLDNYDVLQTEKEMFEIEDYFNSHEFEDSITILDPKKKNEKGE